jgi:hypothetical protein
MDAIADHWDQTYRSLLARRGVMCEEASSA